MTTISHKVVLQKLIRSPWQPEDPPTLTKFSPCDQTSIAIATARATFLQAQLDVETLEKCMELVLEDLPFLAGR